MCHASKLYTGIIYPRLLTLIVFRIVTPETISSNKVFALLLRSYRAESSQPMKALVGLLTIMCSSKSIRLPRIDPGSVAVLYLNLIGARK
jgi:hypothetical protein